MYFTYNDYQTKDCIGRICLSSFAFETPLRNPVSHWTIAGAFERSRRQCNVHFALATLHLSDFKLRPSRRMALVMMVLANASVAGTGRTIQVHWYAFTLPLFICSCHFSRFPLPVHTYFLWVGQAAHDSIMLDWHFAKVFHQSSVLFPMLLLLLVLLQRGGYVMANSNC